MNKSTIITASAGSGKTYSVTTQLLKLLIPNPELCSSILVTTFTKKAAQEIFARLLTRIVSSIQDKKSLETLQNELELPNLSFEDLETSLATIIKHQDELKIQTIDSFFVSLGQIFPIELNIPFQWKISDSWEDEDRRIESLKKTFKSLGFHNLNLLLPLIFRDQQANNVFSSISKEIDSLSKDVVLTNNEAWGFSFKPYPTSNSISDFDSIKSTLEVLQQENKFSVPALKGYLKLVSNFFEENWEEVLISTISKNIKEENFKYYRKDIPEEVRATLTDIIFTSANKLAVTINNQSKGLGALYSEFTTHSLDMIQDNGILSFQDLTTLLATNRESEELNEIYYRLDCKLDYIFIDEFQDTSAMQWIVLKPLIDEIVINNTEERKFIAVGDPKQAIYGWRGGLSDIFSILKEQFPEIEEKPLFTSYRSSPVIIEAVNKIFERPLLPERFSHISESWQERFITHVAKSEDNKGFVEIIGITTLKDKQLLRNSIHSAIKDVIDLERTASSTSTIGILTRTNTQAIAIERYLNSHNINASSISNNPLTSYYTSQIFISILTLASHPSDELAYQHLLGLREFKEKYGSYRRDQLSIHLKNNIYRLGLGTYLKQISVEIKNAEEIEIDIVEHILFLATGLERKNGVDILSLLRILKTSVLPKDKKNLISVLTIHKSKGLEFDHVILPYTADQFHKDQNLRLLKQQPDPFDPPETIVKSCRKDARHFFPQLENIAENMTEASITESLCLAYVAVTRAKRALSILVQSKSTSIDEELTLRSLLAKQFEIDLGFESDVPLSLALFGEKNLSTDNKYIASEEVSNIDSSNVVPSEQTNINLFNFPNFVKKKNLAIKSPSQLESDQNIFAQLKSDSSEKDRKFKVLGTEIHQILALIDKRYCKIDDTLDVLESLRDQFSANSLEIIKEFIQSPVGAELFVSTNQTDIETIYTEFPIRRIIGNELFSGRIDRLEMIESNRQKITIYDFKLENIDGENSSKQMLTYKNLIASQLKIPEESVTCKLISILGKKEKII